MGMQMCIRDSLQGVYIGGVSVFGNYFDRQGRGENIGLVRIGGIILCLLYTSTEEMIGSMQYILAENIGQFVVIEFLIGTEQIVRKQGMLYHVGRSYVTLYDEDVYKRQVWN